MRPLLATIRCVWEIASGSNNQTKTIQKPIPVIKRISFNCTDFAFEADLEPETGDFFLFGFKFQTVIIYDFQCGVQWIYKP